MEKVEIFVFYPIAPGQGLNLKHLNGRLCVGRSGSAHELLSYSTDLDTLFGLLHSRNTYEAVHGGPHVTPLIKPSPDFLPPCFVTVRSPPPTLFYPIFAPPAIQGESVDEVQRYKVLFVPERRHQQHQPRSGSPKPATNPLDSEPLPVFCFAQ